MPEDEPETVYVANYGSGSNPTVYHTDPDCYSFLETSPKKPLSMEVAEWRNLRCCRVCAGDVEPKGPDGDSWATRKRLLAMDSDEVGADD